MIRLTDRLIEGGKTRRGGFTRAQLAVLGVSWPPKAGWKQRLIGTSIDDATLERFYAASGVLARSTKARHRELAKRRAQSDTGSLSGMSWDARQHMRSIKDER